VTLASEAIGNEQESDSNDLNPEEVERVGNLIADDEWLGLSMELTELVRVSVVEETKKNAREFLQKDDYKIGDISKRIDGLVKVIGYVFHHHSFL